MELNVKFRTIQVDKFFAKNLEKIEKIFMQLKSLASACYSVTLLKTRRCIFKKILI